jgi:citrate lyase synthetase
LAIVKEEMEEELKCVVILVVCRILSFDCAPVEQCEGIICLLLQKLFNEKPTLQNLLIYFFHKYASEKLGHQTELANCAVLFVVQLFENSSRNLSAFQQALSENERILHFLLKDLITEEAYSIIQG